jgi:methionyl-tRNA formyltransferase
MRIVFMGTPDFAVASLQALLANGNNVVGVITAPDKPAGRGKTLQGSAVKTFAVEKGLRLLQPTNLKDADFISELKSLEADLQVVVAFRMLPEVVWNMPKSGTINVHASLLPQYRGAAPINWAIINNELTTGVTTFLLQHEIDTGNILIQKKCKITPETNAGDLHDALMGLGAQALTETVDMISSGSIKSIPQNDIKVDLLKSAPKIFKETCQIDWNNDVSENYHLIRGLSPYPAAWSNLKLPDDKIISVKIFETCYVNKQLLPGEIDTDGKNYIHVGCKNGCLSLHNLQIAGKKRMMIKDLLRGFQFSTSHQFL